MNYFLKYKFKIGGSNFRQCEKSRNYCFGEIFNLLKTDNPEIKVNVSMFNDCDHYKHELKFTSEEIAYVFDRLSHAILPPDIEEIVDPQELIVKFTFPSGTASGHIKTVLTLSRYFFESNKDSAGEYDYLSLREVMREVLEYSKLNPEIPFIEVLQLFHYDSFENNGHSIVDFYRKEYPTYIISDATFTQRMKGTSSTVKAHNGIFSGFDHGNDGKKMTTELHLQNFKNITRI